MAEITLPIKEMYDFIEFKQVIPVCLTVTTHDGEMKAFRIFKCTSSVTDTQLDYIVKHTIDHVCGTRFTSSESEDVGTFELAKVLTDLHHNFIVPGKTYDELVEIAREVTPDADECDDGELYFTDFVISIKSKIKQEE